MATEETLLLPSAATYITRCRQVLLRRYVMCCMHPVQEDGALLTGIHGTQHCVLYRSGLSLLCAVCRQWVTTMSVQTYTSNFTNERTLRKDIVLHHHYFAANKT